VTFIARGEHLKAMQQNGLALEGERAIHLPKPMRVFPISASGGWK